MQNRLFVLIISYYYKSFKCFDDFRYSRLTFPEGSPRPLAECEGNKHQNRHTGENDQRQPEINACQIEE